MAGAGIKGAALSPLKTYGKKIVRGLFLLAVAIIALAVFVWYIISWVVNPEPADAGACAASGATNAAFDLSKVGIAYVPNAQGYYGPNPTIINIIYAVGKQMNASDDEILALFVAVDTESGFKNLANDGSAGNANALEAKKSLDKNADGTDKYPHDWWKEGQEAAHDHASVGILQQQALMGWGEINQLMDPAYAAGTFLQRLMSGPSQQYAGNIPMMVQAVQQSGTADGSNYAQNLPAATDLYNQAKAAWEAKNAAGSTTTTTIPRAVGGNVPVSFSIQTKALKLTSAVLDTTNGGAPLVLTPVQTATTAPPTQDKVASVDAIVAATGISTEQATNAQIIAATALKLGYGSKGVLIAIVTALAESSLINVGHGDALGPQSIGLFQQMDSWGPLEQRTDPAGATTLFFKAPGQGVDAMAPDWANLEPWDVAQRVEQSEFDGGGHWYSSPEPYAQNYKDQMDLATKITAAVLNDPTILVDGVGNPTGVDCTTTTGAGNVLVIDGVAKVTNSDSGPYAGQVFNIALPAGEAGKAIQTALGQLGVRYSWGGGDFNGKTLGIHDGGVADSYQDYANEGFDCSGLMLYSVYQATGGRIQLPHYTVDQYAMLDHVSSPAPGDLSFYDPSGIHHVAMYLGKYTQNAQGEWVASTDGTGTDFMIEAPESGDVVKISKLRDGSQMFAHPDYQGSVAAANPVSGDQPGVVVGGVSYIAPSGSISNQPAALV